MYFSNLYKYSLIIVLCGLPWNLSIATTCSDSEPLKTFLAEKDYRNALPELDKCLISKPASAEELRLFEKLLQQVLEINHSISPTEVYQNFQSVLQTSQMSELDFQFAHYFETHPKVANQLFSKVRKTGETYYFYYDTGRMFSHSRGIALTEQSLIWKNLFCKAHRLAFDQIKKVTLVYELGLSLTGWKLRINQNPDYEIRLSRIPHNAIIPFVSALIYFINSNQTILNQTKVQLEVPEIEEAILAGWVTSCSKNRKQDNPIQELQLLDACFARFLSHGNDFRLSQSDRKFLNTLIMSIFAKTNLPFPEGYQNFRIILLSHFFRGLDFKFKGSTFDRQTQTQLFQEIRNPTESYYFYFDTGKMTSNASGLALTENSILWKNAMGKAHQLAFQDISKVTLHETGLGFTNWKLRFNDNKDNEIVLSHLSDENSQLFASALIYFINIASQTNLTLQVP